MNPWALDKDRGIKRLLVQLQGRLGKAGFELLPRRSDVAEAVTLCKPGAPGLAAFVFTYGQADGRFGVHLAYPFPDSSVPESAEELTASQLVELLAIHFDAPGLGGEAEAVRTDKIG